MTSPIKKALAFLEYAMDRCPPFTNATEAEGTATTLCGRSRFACLARSCRIATNPWRNRGATGALRPQPPPRGRGCVRSKSRSKCVAFSAPSVPIGTTPATPTVRLSVDAASTWTARSLSNPALSATTSLSLRPCQDTACGMRRQARVSPPAGSPPASVTSRRCPVGRGSGPSGRHRACPGTRRDHAVSALRH